MGSPPQVRGKLLALLSHLRRSGITPAGAGKTAKFAFRHGQFTDHPRRCGENTAQTNNIFTAIGSPPQVRGKPSCRGLICRRLRITPAGAGKTLQPRGLWHWRRDHPRRCGENIHAESVPCNVGGSPPQVRGKRRETCHSLHVLGITPAGAGKTLKRSFRNQPFCS